MILIIRPISSIPNEVILSKYETINVTKTILKLSRPRPTSSNIAANDAIIKISIKLKSFK